MFEAADFKFSELKKIRPRLLTSHDPLKIFLIRVAFEKPWVFH